jgi:hypothetical protein
VNRGIAVLIRELFELQICVKQMKDQEQIHTALTMQKFNSLAHQQGFMESTRGIFVSIPNVIAMLYGYSEVSILYLNIYNLAKNRSFFTQPNFFESSHHALFRGAFHF